MAAEPHQSAISAAFPAPPPFYKSFTAENLDLLQQHVQSSGIESNGPLLPPIAGLPPVPDEIRNLVPPAPPADGKYRSFGTLHDINPPSATLKAVPTRENLLNLTDRLMQLFRRYVQIMATNPAGELWVPKWEEIKKTFEEVHGVINEYRPHEAREILILMYEDQIAQVKEETEKVKISIERAREVMEDLGSGRSAEGDVAVTGKPDFHEGRISAQRNELHTAKAREQMVWKLIESEVGRA